MTMADVDGVIATRGVWLTEFVRAGLTVEEAVDIFRRMSPTLVREQELAMWNIGADRRWFKYPYRPLYDHLDRCGPCGPGKAKRPQRAGWLSRRILRRHARSTPRAHRPAELTENPTA